MKEGEWEGKESHVKCSSGQAAMEIVRGNTKEIRTASKKLVSCTKCGISLCKNNLKRHMNRFHLKEKPGEKMPFELDKPRIKSVKKGQEETKWNVSSRLKSNDALSHQNGKLGCDECGKSFSCSNTVFFHKRIVHRGKKLQCKTSGCEVTFSSYRARKDHERMVHGHPKLRCKFEGCSSEFFSKFGRVSHHRSKH